MIHSFSFDGLNIVVDIGSGSVHVVDRLALEAISMYDQGLTLEKIEKELTGKFPHVQDFMGEFTSLLEQNLLFCSAESPPPALSSSPVVKALCLHVAHDCNLSCRYCFAGQGRFTGPKSLMQAETGFQAVDFLLTRSEGRRNVEIDFFGGEPLLNFPVIQKVTAYAEKAARSKGKKIKFTLTTNGLLLKGKMGSYFQDKGFSVVLSLDGRREINDTMRPLPHGGGSFSKIYPNIRDFVAARNHENYVVRGTYTRHNLDFARDVAFLAGMGFKSISMEPVVGGDQEDYALRWEDAPLLLKEYENLTRFYVQEKTAGRPFSFFHFILDLTGGPCLNKRVKGCGAGTEYLAVTPEGHLYPCHQFVGEEAFKLGDLASGKLDVSLVEDFAGANVYSKEHCASCWARYYCGGGCHANAFKRGGDIRGADELGCLLEKKRLECAIYLQALEKLTAAELTAGPA